jgi:hypothetical protein
MIDFARALPGRDTPMPVANRHAVLGTPLKGPFPEGFERIAEDYHQQYLHKNPWGYCGLGGTGVSCPVGLGSAAPAVTAAP